jgi:hypothetical protein
LFSNHDTNHALINRKAIDFRVLTYLPAGLSTGLQQRETRPVIEPTNYRNTFTKQEGSKSIAEQRPPS